MIRSCFRLLGWLLVVTAFTGCGQNDEPTRQIDFVPLSSLEIVSQNPQAAAGTTNRFTAIGHYGNPATFQFTRDLTSQVTWASTNPAVLTVSNDPDTGRPRQRGSRRHRDGDGHPGRQPHRPRFHRQRRDHQFPEHHAASLHQPQCRRHPAAAGHRRLLRRHQPGSDRGRRLEQQRRRRRHRRRRGPRQRPGHGRGRRDRRYRRQLRRQERDPGPRRDSGCPAKHRGDGGGWEYRRRGDDGAVDRDRHLQRRQLRGSDRPGDLGLQPYHRGEGRSGRRDPRAAERPCRRHQPRSRRRWAA